MLASNELAFIDAAASVTAVKEESAPGASDECDDDEEAVAAKAAAAARAAARLERLQRLPPATIVEMYVPLRVSPLPHSHTHTAELTCAYSR